MLPTTIEVLASNNSRNDGVYPKIILKDGSEEIFSQYINANSGN
jgi:hypothetical protein